MRWEVKDCGDYGELDTGKWEQEYFNLHILREHTPAFNLSR